MSNEKSMLPNGFGMPFVKVTDSKNKPIIDALSQLPIGELVTSFDYTYREEKDDECNITINCNNPDLIDLPSLREQQYLMVQWGWVYSDSTYIPGVPRKVMVRDVNMRFSNQGIIITLKCTDGFSIMKSQQLKKNTEDNFANWIKGALSNNYKFKCYINDAKPQRNLKNPKSFLDTPKKGYHFLNGVDIFIMGHEGLRETEVDQLIQTRTFMQVSKTPYTAIKDATKYIPNGPYHLDTRDDEVTIHPTNFNQAPIATFTWNGGSGEVISFVITTRKKAKYTDVAKKSEIDGETKSLNSQLTQTDGGNPNLNVDGITGAAIPAKYDSRVDGITGAAVKPPTDQFKDSKTTKALLEKDQNILRQEAPKYLEQVVNAYKEANGDPTKLASISLGDYTVKIKAKVKDTVNPEDYGTMEYEQSTPGYSRTTGWDKLKRDKTVQIVPKPDGSKYEYWDNPEVVQEKELDLVLSAKDLLGYAGDADSSNILAFNQINDALQKQVEGTLTIIGHPNIISSKIINLQGVSKKYSGDWYIKEANHRLDPSSGYTLTLELIKKTSSNGTIVQSNVNVNNQSLAKRIQKIANDMRDADIAKAAEVKSAQDKILQQYEDAGQVIVVTDETGMPVAVSADEDWVSLNKATQTKTINKNDQVLKDKSK